MLFLWLQGRAVAFEKRSVALHRLVCPWRQTLHLHMQKRTYTETPAVAVTLLRHRRQQRGKGAQKKKSDTTPTPKTSVWTSQGGGGWYETPIPPPNRHPISYIKQPYTKSYSVKGTVQGGGVLQSA